MRWACAMAGVICLACGMVGAKAGEEKKGGDKPDHLLQEQEKHLKRLATFDRIEEIAKETSNDTLREKVDMLREKELRRHEKVMARLTGAKEHGKADDHDHGKSDDHGHGKSDDQDHGKSAEHDHGRPDEKGKDAGHGRSGEQGEHGKEGGPGKPEAKKGGAGKKKD